MSNGSKVDNPYEDLLKWLDERDLAARDRREVAQELKELIAPEVVEEERKAQEEWERKFMEIFASIRTGMEDFGKPTIKVATKDVKPKSKRKAKKDLPDAKLTKGPPRKGKRYIKGKEQ